MGFFMPEKLSTLNVQLSLQDAFELHQLDLDARRLTKSTKDFYRKLLSPFIVYCNEQQLTLSDITHIHIKKYLIKYNEHKAHTQHAHARALRAFFNYCVSDGLLDTSPFSKVKMPKKGNHILPAFTQEEIKKILSVCNKTEKAICLTLLSSGLRAQELINLNSGDIDGTTVTVKSGKGQKDRITFVNASALKAIKLYHLEIGYTPTLTDPLFISQKGSRFTSNGFQHLIQRLQKRSKIKHCSAHTFRRTFAITCLRNSMNIFVLAKLMGHAQINVLKHYLSIIEDDLEASYKEFGIDNL